MGHITGDCVTRALSKALDLPYEKVLELQYMKAKKLCYYFSSPEIIQSILEDYGYTAFPEEIEQGSRWYMYGRDIPTVNRLCMRYKDRNVVCRTINHLVTCIKGNIYDTFDSSTEEVIQVYIK